MKNFILRKPKFMRNDEEMMHYLRMFEALAEQMEKANTVKEICDLMGVVEDIISKAAKAGGFFRKKDFWKYIENEATA